MARYVVDVMPKREILDPQGKAVLGALPRLGFEGVIDVRQGKRFEVDIDGDVDEERLAAVRRMAETLLANPVIEYFTVTVDGESPTSLEPAPSVEPESSVEPVETTAQSSVEPAPLVEPVETTAESSVEPPPSVEPVETTAESSVEPVETTHESSVEPAPSVEPVETTAAAHHDDTAERPAVRDDVEDPS